MLLWFYMSPELTSSFCMTLKDTEKMRFTLFYITSSNLSAKLSFESWLLILVKVATRKWLCILWKFRVDRIPQCLHFRRTALKSRSKSYARQDKRFTSAFTTAFEFNTVYLKQTEEGGFPVFRFRNADRSCGTLHRFKDWKQGESLMHSAWCILVYLRVVPVWWQCDDEGSDK